MGIKVEDVVKNLESIIRYVEEQAEKGKEHLKKVPDELKKIKPKNTKETFDAVALSLNSLIATKIKEPIEGFSKNIIDDTPTHYDEAVDKFFNETKIGGSYHRHFDGHDPASMWETVKNTLQTDTRLEEMAAFTNTFMKDLQTTRGLPWTKTTPEAMDKAGEFASKFGVNKSYLYDQHSINLPELFCSCLAVFAVIFKWDKQDKEIFSKVAGSLLVSGVVGGNLITVIISLIAIARAYNKSKITNNFKNFNQGLKKGSLITTAFIATSLAIGGPILIGLLAGIIAAFYTHRILKEEVDFDNMDNEIKKSIKLLPHYK